MLPLPIQAFGLQIGGEAGECDLRLVVRKGPPPDLPLAYERRAIGQANASSSVFSDGVRFVEQFHHGRLHVSFFVDPERRTVVVFDSDAPEALVEHHLFDHVIPATLQLLGRLCFHGSAVALPQGVVAFVAPSGTGKSTLAAFLARTHPLVTDDALVVEQHEGVVLAHPSLPRSRLRTDSHAALGGPQGEMAAGKRVVPRTGPNGPLRLSAICLLSRQPGDAPPTLERSKGVAALPELLREVHRFSSRDARVVQREMIQLMDVLAVVPTYRLRLPAAFERLPEVEHLLKQL